MAVARRAPSAALAGAGVAAGFGASPCGDDFLVTGVVESVGCIGVREPSDSAGTDETQLSARNAPSHGNCWRRNAVLTHASGPASFGASS